jgi:hypothetical protein
MSESHAADGPYDLDPRTCTHPEDQLDHSGPWNKDRLTCKACGAPVKWDSRPRLVLVHPEMMVAQAPPIQASTPEHVALHSIAQALKVSGQAHEVGMLAVKVIQERDKLSTERAAIAKIIGRVNYPIGELTKHVQGVWNDAVQHGEYVTRTTETFVQIRAERDALKAEVDTYRAQAKTPELDAGHVRQLELIIRSFDQQCTAHMAAIGYTGHHDHFEEHLKGLKDEIARDQTDQARAQHLIMAISGLYPPATFSQLYDAVKATKEERDRLTIEHASIKADYDDAKGEAAEARAELEEVKVENANLLKGVCDILNTYATHLDGQPVLEQLRDVVAALKKERDALAAKEPTRAYAEGILHDIQMALGLTNSTPRSELAEKAREAMDRGDRAWATIHAIAAALGLTTWRADELPVVARDLKAASAQPPRRWNAGSLVQRLMSEYPGNPSPSVIARALVLLGAIDS